MNRIRTVESRGCSYAGSHFTNSACSRPVYYCRDIDVRTGTKLVMISDLKQSLDLRRLNEASSLYS